MMHVKWMLLILTGALLLAACGVEAKTGPVETVQAYYQAIIDERPDRLANLTCAAFEAEAQTELDSFRGVKTTLDGLKCAETGKDGEFTLVTCSGKIVATYGNEVLDFPLDGRVHRVKEESGDWRVCGY